MTTATVPMNITCPDWCEVPASEHLRDLWDMGGNCIHHAPIVHVADTVGLHGALETTTFAGRAELNITSQTSPDGRESAPPIVHLYGVQQMSVSQALALAEAIREQVYTYRVAGGVA